MANRLIEKSIKIKIIYRCPLHKSRNTNYYYVLLQDGSVIVIYKKIFFKQQMGNYKEILKNPKMFNNLNNNLYIFCKNAQRYINKKGIQI